MKLVLWLPKRSLRLLGAALALALVAPDQGYAENPPPVDNVGRFLGLTVECGCVSADADYAFPVYHAFLEDQYGATYADQAMGHMKLALHEAYDNQLTICGFTCGRDIVAFLQELLNDAPKIYGELNSTPAAPAEELQDESDVPECSATEDLVPGIGCVDRQESPVSVATATDEVDVEDTGNYGNWHVCYWRPNSPRCKDLDDPSSPIGN